MKRVAGVLLIALCWLAASAAAQDMAIPYLSGRVVDQAEILSAPARERLATMLQAHERATGNQIVVLTITGLRRGKRRGLAVRVFEEWKLGSREKDNGVLILVVPQDRRIRIEVGYGLEGTLTDVAASRIIRDLMTPRFREGNYDVGIEAGVTAVIQILEGRPPAAADAEWLDPEGKTTSGFQVRAPDMPLAERILIGAVRVRHNRPVHLHRPGHAGRNGLVPVLLPDPVLVACSRCSYSAAAPRSRYLAPTPCSIRSPRSSFPASRGIGRRGTT